MCHFNARNNLVSNTNNLVKREYNMCNAPLSGIFQQIA